MPVDKRAFLYPMTAGPASMPKKRLSELAVPARSPAGLSRSSPSNGYLRAGRRHPGNAIWARMAAPIAVVGWRATMPG